MSAEHHKQKQGYLNKRSRAFRYAASGLIESLRREPHMRIHAVAAIIVTSGGFYFRISPAEWIIVIFSICMVMASELVNTAVEKICDMVHPEQHPTIKYIKDISSASVLLVCLSALIAGIIIFKPYLWQSLGF